jgi:hypothetical protein
MPTVEEVYQKVKFLREKGDGNRKTHFGLIDVEAKERIANPKGKVRFIFECVDADTCSEFHVEKDRIYEAVGNVAVAQEIMLKLWRSATTELCQSWARSDDAEGV